MRGKDSGEERLLGGGRGPLFPTKAANGTRAFVQLCSAVTSFCPAHQPREGGQADGGSAGKAWHWRDSQEDSRWCRVPARGMLWARTGFCIPHSHPGSALRAHVNAGSFQILTHAVVSSLTHSFIQQACFEP